MRTRELYDKRKAQFSTMSIAERKEASKAIASSSREDYRAYVDGILSDMEVADRTGNIREVTKLTKILSGKSNSDSIMPSKDLTGKPITSNDQYLHDALQEERQR